MLENNGLVPAAAIIDNYGIDSETDLFVLDPDDFSKLASRGLKPLHVKNLSAGVRLCVNVRRTCCLIPQQQHYSVPNH